MGSDQSIFFGGPPGEQSKFKTTQYTIKDISYRETHTRFQFVECPGMFILYLNLENVIPEFKIGEKVDVDKNSSSKNYTDKNSPSKLYNFMVHSIKFLKRRNHQTFYDENTEVYEFIDNVCIKNIFSLESSKQKNKYYVDIFSKYDRYRKDFNNPQDRALFFSSIKVGDSIYVEYTPTKHNTIKNLELRNDVLIRRYGRGILKILPLIKYSLLNSECIPYIPNEVVMLICQTIITTSVAK
jgi:hypothetical protein